jgi:hypothetical protein
LRALLECGSLADCRALTETHWALGKSASITVAQGSSSICFELFDDHIATVPTPHRSTDTISDAHRNASSGGPGLTDTPLPHQWFVRANHYLSAPINHRSAHIWASSYYRYESARKYCEQSAHVGPLGLPQMHRLLLDCSPQPNTGLCVFAPFQPVCGTYAICAHLLHFNGETVI